MNVELHQLDLRYEKLRTHKPEAERKLVGSLAAIGQQVPVVVVHGEGPEHFVLVDGYKRVRALRRLGHDLVGATCWDLSEAEALVLDRLMRTGEGATALEQGWLLHELSVRFALSLEDLGRRFARSVSWVSRRLALVEELPDAIQAHVQRGALPAHAAMKYLVPLARANADACARLVTGVAGKGLTNREVGQLYAAWREGLPAIRERVLTAEVINNAPVNRYPSFMAAMIPGVNNSTVDVGGNTGSPTTGGGALTVHGSRATDLEMLRNGVSIATVETVSRRSSNGSTIEPGGGRPASASARS